MVIAQICANGETGEGNVWILHKNENAHLYIKRKRMCGNENDLKIQRKQSSIVAESLRNHIAQYWKLLTSFPYHRPDGSAPVGAKTL